MTTGQAILACFDHDDVVLRPSEIIRRTGRNTEIVRTTLKRLVAAGRLFHICHSQYARKATTAPLRPLPRADVKEILIRLEKIEARLAKMESAP